MRLNEFLPLLDRETRLLTDDNWHASAAVCADAAARLRRMAETMRAAGLNPDEET